MSRISVICTLYNSEATLRSTVLSVLNQSHENFELILINDGSTDNSLKVIESIEDPRIRIVNQSHQGISAARNNGLRLARGEYLSFIDADDLWAPDKLKSQLRVLKSAPGCNVVYSWVVIIDARGNFLRAVKPVFHAGDVYPQMMERSFIVNTSNLLFHKKVLLDTGYFDETLEMAQDWDFYIRLASKHHFALDRKYRIFYRQHRRSHSTNLKRTEEYLNKVINKAFEATSADLLGNKVHAQSYCLQHLANKHIENSPRVKGSFEAVARLAKALSIDTSRSLDITFWGILAKAFLNLLLPFGYSRKIFSDLYLLELRFNRHWDNKLLSLLETLER